MKFFFDNCLPPQLARGIDGFLKFEKSSAIPLRDKFAANISDVEWINALREEGGWIVISSDGRITKNKAELAAWKASGLLGFFLGKTWSNQLPWEQAWRLTKYFPLVIDQSKRLVGGATFEVTINGKFKQLNL